jgi:predicted RNase H-like nuclease (RuvC/YqgF family)
LSRVNRAVEHITKIRQQLAQGTTLQNHGSREQYLDAVGYWRTMYQDSQKEIDNLQTSISEVEREKLKLEAEVSKMRSESVDVQALTARPSTALPKAPRTKRKKLFFQDDSGLQHKKLKTGYEVMPSMSATNSVIMDELVAFEEAAGLGTLLRYHSNDNR